jgi:hypothetical protein
MRNSLNSARAGQTTSALKFTQTVKRDTFPSVMEIYLASPSYSAEGLLVHSFLPGHIV